MEAQLSNNHPGVGQLGCWTRGLSAGQRQSLVDSERAVPQQQPQQQQQQQQQQLQDSQSDSSFTQRLVPMSCTDDTARDALRAVEDLKKAALAAMVHSNSAAEAAAARTTTTTTTWMRMNHHRDGRAADANDLDFAECVCTCCDGLTDLIRMGNQICEESESNTDPVGSAAASDTDGVRLTRQSSLRVRALPLAELKRAEPSLEPLVAAAVAAVGRVPGVVRFLVNAINGSAGVAHHTSHSVLNIDVTPSATSTTTPHPGCSAAAAVSTRLDTAERFVGAHSSSSASDTSAERPRAAASALWALMYRSPANKQAAAAAGAAVSLTKALLNVQQTWCLRQQGTESSRSLGQSNLLREWRFSQSGRVRVLCGALRCFVFNCDENIDAVVAEGCIRPLVQLLMAGRLPTNYTGGAADATKTSDSAKLPPPALAQVCAALKNVARLARHRAAVAAAGGVDALLACLRTCWSHPGVLDHVCEALAFFTSDAVPDGQACPDYMRGGREDSAQHEVCSQAAILTQIRNALEEVLPKVRGRGRDCVTTCLFMAGGDLSFPSRDEQAAATSTLAPQHSSRRMQSLGAKVGTGTNTGKPARWAGKQRRPRSTGSKSLQGNHGQRERHRQGATNAWSSDRSGIDGRWR